MPGAEAPPATTEGTRPPPLVVPVYRPRDRWLYDDGYALIVSDVFPDGTTRFVRMDNPDLWQVRSALFWVEMQSARSRRTMLSRSADPLGLFEARVGEPILFERQYDRDGDIIRHETSWVIEGTERVTVPAGSFDTWVLVKRTRSLVSDWTGFERWWYSPAVRNYVRLEYRYGDASVRLRELVNFELADGS